MSRIPIALQLYSVRHDAEADLAGTLAAVADMGYEGVEFAGFHGYAAENVRAMADAAGLVIVGNHTPYAALQDGTLAETIAYHKVLGSICMVVPGLPPPNVVSRGTPGSRRRVGSAPWRRSCLPRGSLPAITTIGSSSSPWTARCPGRPCSTTPTRP